MKQLKLDYNKRSHYYVFDKISIDVWRNAIRIIIKNNDIDDLTQVLDQR